MHLRPYSPSDHPLLSAWWEGHGHPVIPSRAIPPFSWFVHTAEHDLAFASAYLDNGGTGFAMLEWITTRPQNTPRESLRALNTLLPWMRDHLATQLDYDLILATCRQPSLARLLEKHRFLQTDASVSHHLFTRS